MPLTTPLKKAVPQSFQLKKNSTYYLSQNKWLEKSSDTHFNTIPKTWDIKKTKKNKTNKVFCFRKKKFEKKKEIMETMIVIFQEWRKKKKKNRTDSRDGDYFFCVCCMLCINQIFLILAPGLMLDPIFFTHFGWKKKLTFVIPIY